MPCQSGLVKQFDIPHIVVTLQIHRRNNPNFDSEDVALAIFDHHKNEKAWTWLEIILGVEVLLHGVQHTEFLKSELHAIPLTSYYLVRCQSKVAKENVLLNQISLTRLEKGNFKPKSRYQGWILVHGYSGVEGSGNDARIYMATSFLHPFKIS